MTPCNNLYENVCINQLEEEKKMSEILYVFSHNLLPGIGSVT